MKKLWVSSQIEKFLVLKSGRVQRILNIVNS